MSIEQLNPTGWRKAHPFKDVAGLLSRCTSDTYL